MRTLIRAGWVVGHEAGHHRLTHDGVVVYEGNKIVYVGKTSDGRVDTPSTLSESSSRRALPTSLLLSRALTDVTSFHQHVRW
jgi:hypothetical protein